MPLVTPAPSSAIDTIFIDVGGVLGSNGWDHEARVSAARAFDLDAEEYEYRHHDAVGPWEEGRISMDEYLALTVFYTTRTFSVDEFRSYIFAHSIPNVAMLDIARSLARSRGYRLMTLNNESAELNEYRIRRFRLDQIFSAFLTSCYFGVRKPMPDFYRRALGVAHVAPEHALLIDDRPQNLIPAEALGMRAILYTTPDAVSQSLAALGITVSL